LTGPQPAAIFGVEQTDYNLFLHLTTKHVSENFGKGNCPVAPLGWGFPKRNCC